MKNNSTKTLYLLFCLLFFTNMLLAQCPDPEAAICDDFEGYTLDNISSQAAHWNPWGGVDGAVDDAVVSDAMASSGTQSLLISEANGDDMLLLLGNQTEGQHLLSWKLYVPSGSTGYFNTQKIEGNPGGEFGMQVEFFADGTATLDAGTADVVTHNWTADTWMDIALNVDLETDWIIYTINGDEIFSWPASWGTFMQSGLKQLGAVNFFGNVNTVQYIDDVVFKDLTEPTINVSFNVNMSNETVAGDGVFIAGEMNNWSGESMIDVGNGSWSKSYEITVGDTIEYLFQNGAGIDEIIANTDCTLDATGNRYVIAGDVDMEIAVVCYSECTDCTVSAENLKFDASISISPNPANYSVNLNYDFDQTIDLKVTLMNNLGQQIDYYSLHHIQNGNYPIIVEDLPGGVYFLHLTDGENSIMKKLAVE